MIERGSMPTRQYTAFGNHMKNKRLKTLVSACVLVIALPLAAATPQKQQTAAVKERDVRAEMYFLAGDAMQGRGSGTPFERIAAEYIGSQFMQYGLEPAGDKDTIGQTSFVQTVPVLGKKVVDAFKADGALAKQVNWKQNLVAFRMADADMRGPLQKLKVGETAKAGNVVLLSVGEDAQFNDVFGAYRALIQSGTKTVIIPANKQITENWAMLAERDVEAGEQGNLIFVDAALGKTLSSMKDGSEIAFNATFKQQPDTSTWNAIGKITGSDPKLAAQTIVLSAHLDHLGISKNEKDADRINNGADDDASGSVAVMELARALAAGNKPKRTIYFVCFGSEEAGGFGSKHFLNTLPFPKENFVANLQFEMMGRPDDKVPPQTLWLTGYDRSNLGAELAKRGARLVADPHPEENFFQRSDNYTFARQGIIAHTVSSYGLHKDYHHASDEIGKIDFSHMTRSIDSMVKPIQWLANSDFVPVWGEGKKP